MDVCQGHREVGATGAFCPGPHPAYGPQKSIYSNRKFKYSIKAVTTYILPLAPQVLSAALMYVHTYIHNFM